MADERIGIALVVQVEACDALVRTVEAVERTKRQVLRSAQGLNVGTEARIGSASCALG